MADIISVSCLVPSVSRVRRFDAPQIKGIISNYAKLQTILIKRIGNIQVLKKLLT